jgi:proline iminopeptidase
MMLPRAAWLLVPGLLIAVGPPAHAQDAPSEITGVLQVAGARLFVRSVGEGTPLVILHGGPGMSHDYLAPQLIHLLAGDYRLHFYDQRASGRSTGLDDSTRLTIAQFVEDLEEVRQALRLERMNLLGHSFGGLLALHYATEYPSRVEKLLLVDSSPASWELNFPHFRRTIAERRTEDEQREMDELRAREGFGRDPVAMERYMRVSFRTFFHDRTLSDSLALGITEQWITNLDVTNRLVWDDLGSYDIHDRLVRITAPTLILHGDASVISPEGAVAIHERIPASRLIVLRDVGHFPHIEAPRAFQAAVKAFIW